MSSALNFTREETFLLMKLVAENKEIILNDEKDAKIWTQKKEKWSEIELLFNAAEVGPFRNDISLQNKWRHLSSKCNKELLKCKQNIGITGGSPQSMNDISEVSKIVLSIKSLKYPINISSWFDKEFANFRKNIVASRCNPTCIEDVLEFSKIKQKMQLPMMISSGTRRELTGCEKNIRGYICDSTYTKDISKLSKIEERMESPITTQDDFEESNSDMSFRKYIFSKEETLLLLKLVEENKDIILNRGTDANTWLEKKEKWSEIEEKFNAAEMGPFRNDISLQNKWRHLSSACNKELKKCKENNIGTGSTQSIEDISEVSKIVLSIKSCRSPIAISSGYKRKIDCRLNTLDSSDDSGSHYSKDISELSKIQQRIEASMSTKKVPDPDVDIISSFEKNIFTREETLLLLKLVEENKEIILNEEKKATKWKEKKEKWVEIEYKFNATGIGSFRSYISLQNKWRVISSKCTKKLADSKQNIKDTGSPCKNDFLEFSDIIQRINPAITTRVQNPDKKKKVKKKEEIEEREQKEFKTDLEMMYYNEVQNRECMMIVEQREMDDARKHLFLVNQYKKRRREEEIKDEEFNNIEDKTCKTEIIYSTPDLTGFLHLS